MKGWLLLTFWICAACYGSGQTKTAEELDQVARVASVIVDGDVCERILTPRAAQYLLKVDPRDQWAASDNFDVNHDAYIQIKKTLIRLGRVGPPHTDVNLWMPVPGDSSRIQVMIRNVNEISQFWTWGDLHQPMPPEMKEVLMTGKRKIVMQKPNLISVLAPVSNSLGDIVGLVEVVKQLVDDPHGNVK
ncbi:MAG: hypothetical protein IRZ15_02215 [Bryobacteraceae bacterium]|nr:hypothetical protein [Bryobacteraceae bacterium]